MPKEPVPSSMFAGASRRCCCEVVECKSVCKMCKTPLNRNSLPSRVITRAAFVLVCVSLLPPNVSAGGQECAGIVSRRTISSVEPEFLVRSHPGLRKSVSYTSKMNHADLRGDDHADLCSPSAYLPAHSSGDLRRAEALPSHVLRGGSAQASLRSWAPDSSEEPSPNVYTRLQTQLYPEVRF